MRFTEALMNFPAGRSAQAGRPRLKLISLSSLILKPLVAFGSWRRVLRVNGCSQGAACSEPVGAVRSRRPAFVNVVLLAIHRGRSVPCHDCTGTEAFVLSDKGKHRGSVPPRDGSRLEDTSRAKRPQHEYNQFDAE